MIQVGSKVHVADNSGAKKVECIKVYNTTTARVGRVGERILVSVKEVTQAQPQKVKKGQIFKAIILETKAPILRRDGSSLTFARNTVCLVSPQDSPMGTRIQGYAPYELRQQHRTKVLALASATL